MNENDPFILHKNSHQICRHRRLSLSVPLSSAPPSRSLSCSLPGAGSSLPPQRRSWFLPPRRWFFSGSPAPVLVFSPLSLSIPSTTHFSTTRICGGFDGTLPQVRQCTALLSSTYIYTVTNMIIFFPFLPCSSPNPWCSLSSLFSALFLCSPPRPLRLMCNTCKIIYLEKTYCPLNL